MEEPEITLEHLLLIAKAGYNKQIIEELIPWERLKIHKRSYVYRLYDPYGNFFFMLPNVVFLSIYVEDDMIQFADTSNRHFNHLGAIRKMEELGYIKKQSNV